MAALVSNFGVQGLRFFTMTLLARRLGLHLFGVYNYLLLLLTYGFIVVEFGLKNLGIREIAQGRGSPKLIKQIFKIRLGFATVSTIVIVLLTGLAFPGGDLEWPSFFMGASLFIDALLLDYVLIAHEALVPQGLGNLGQAGFLFGACYFFVGGSQNFTSLTQFFFLSHIVWILILAVAARPYLQKTNSSADAHRNASHGNRSWKTALMGSPFMISTLIAGILTSMDLLLLGQFHYDNWLGPYSAAMKILGLAMGLINSLLASIQPKLAKQSASLRSAETESLISSTTRFLWLFVAPTVAGCWLFGDQLVLWVFGSNFEKAGPLLKPLSLSFAFLTLSMAPFHLISVSHHTRQLLKIVIFNCLFSLLAVGGVLVLDKPQWVPWAMVLVEFCFLLSVWKWYGIWKVATPEDFKFLLIPMILLIIPLVIPNLGAAPRFLEAAVGYGAGLFMMKVWKQTWFKEVFGKGV